MACPVMLAMEVQRLSLVCQSCALWARFGYPVPDYSRHPDPFVRWAAELGRREGEWLKHRPG